MLKNVYSMPSEFPNSVWESSAFELILLTNDSERAKVQRIPILENQKCQNNNENAECWMLRAWNFPLFQWHWTRKKRDGRDPFYSYRRIYVNCESLCWYHLLLLLHCLALGSPTTRTIFVSLSVECWMLNCSL